MMQECPTGPINVTVVSKWTSAQPLTGNCNLIHRIDNVIAMKVSYVAITLDPSSYPKSQGTLFTLGSNKLGSELAKNPFQFGVSTNSNTQSAVAFSNIVGLFAPVFGQDGQSSQLEISDINKKMKFKRPIPIERFDWFIAGLGGNITTPAAYAIEMTFSFYTMCDCNKSY
jgi:hypothetical protein